MEECLFCKIAKGEIPSKKVYEDDKILCFEDINPRAPVHVLLISKKHIESLNDLSQEDLGLMGYMMLMVKEIAKKMNIYDGGYRVAINCGKDGGQEVPHIHLHILGGKTFN